MRKAFCTGIFFALCLTACGKKGKVSPELLRVGSGSRSGVGVSSNLTINSLKVPIRSVSLNSSASGGDGSQIYNCSAGSNDGCLVDLASAGELQNLLSSSATEVSAGTYTHVQISTCEQEGKYTALINASGTSDPGGSGSTLYTQSGSGELTTTSASAGEAVVYFTGCSRLYPLPSPVTVTEGGTVTVKLYFDIRDIAFFGDATVTAGNEAWFSGGSSYVYPTSPTGTYVGVNYLDVAGTVDAGTPTVSRFRVTTNSGDIGTFGLLYTSTGDYFGGFTRSYYSSATTSGHNRFVTPIQTFTDNGDGTFTVANYGSSATGPGYFNATNFVKSTSATAKDFTDNTGASAGTYTIEAID